MAACVTLILGSIVSFWILKTQNGSVLRAMINWLIMITGLYCCLVVMIRATTWLCLSTDEKNYDMKNQTVYELQYGRGVEIMFQNTMRSKHCCGISNILDWSELKFSAETSTGEYVQISDEFESHRFVPDICCVKETPSCGNEAYDKVEDKLLMSDFQVKDRKEFQKIRDNPPTDGKTVILKIPNPLKDMLLYKMETLEKISNSICSKDENIKNATVLYIYYHGLVRKSHDGESLIACRLGEDCEDADDIPYMYPNADVFCSMIGQLLGLNSLVHELEIELLQKSGLLYTVGCQEYLIGYIDGFCIFSLIYSFVILIGLCWEIGTFHKQFWIYK
ncbi:unnamed protein product [Orchesella dallaii]|uniref:Uncharacterized protein n=1 Tax=Orchesella dallaii TaxID=48710 RepID=A0ABP1Q9J4_9HEXA